MKQTKLLAALGGMLSLAACAVAPQEGIPCEGPCCDEPCGPQRAPLGWEGPVLLWSGSAAVEPPACPEEAPELQFDGFDGLSVTQSCPSCSCSTPACRPTSGMVAWDAPYCGEDPNAPSMTWLTPEDWDGSCIHAEPIIPWELTTSVRIFAARRAPCSPIPGPEPQVAETSWATRARACRIREERAAIRPPPQGFGRCVALGGEIPECPTGYPERRVFHGGLASDLGCTPCTCGPPSLGKCLYQFGIHAAAGCTAASALYGGLGYAEGCSGGSSPLTNLSIVSMQATFVEDAEPGSCDPAGGAPVGAAQPVEPTTFCCEKPW